MVFRGFGVIKFGGAKGQPAAPIETFARINVFHACSKIAIDLNRF